MPSAGGAGLRLPRFGPIGENAFKDLESQFWLGGGRGVNNLKGLRAPKAPRFKFSNPFARRAPGVKPPVKPPSVIPNPVQASDDVVRAVQHAASPAAAKPPVAGRTFQYVKLGLVSGGVVGGAIYGPGIIRNAGQAAGDAAAAVGSGVGQGAGNAAEGTFSGLGAGLADLFAGAFGGAGAGVGSGVQATLTGVGEGLKKVALPALLLGAGFLVFTALKDR